MPIQFYCQGCGQPFKVAESMAGQPAKCKRCGTIVTVPFPAAQGGLVGNVGQASGPTHQAGSPIYAGQAPHGAATSLSPAVWVAIGVGAALSLMVLGAMVAGGLNKSPDHQNLAAGAPQPAPAARQQPTVRGPAKAAPNDSPAQPHGFSFQPEPASSSPSPFETPAANTATPPAETSTDNRNRASSPSPFAPASEPAAASPSATNNTSAPSKPAPWGGGNAGSGELRIPFDDREEVTVGPSGCPVLVVGKNIWHIDSGRIAAELEKAAKDDGHTALSANGQYFAAALKSPNQENTPVRVWNCSTGKVVCEIPGVAERYLDILQFAHNQTLILAGRSSTEIHVWDVETGKQLKSITAPSERLDQGKLAFTQDGEYFATVARDKLVVIETKNGKTAAMMGNPKALERGALGSPPTAARASSNDATFIYAWIQAMRFSADSQELAAVSTHPVPRLIAWNNRGKVVFDEPLHQLPRMAFWEHTLQWLPDRSGWIISGNVLDRETGRLVLGVRKHFAKDLVVYALDKDRLLGTFPHSPSELTVIAIPWKRIQESTRLLKENAPAMLSPASPVSVHVELGELRGDQQETVQKLGLSLTARLARDGIRVQEGQTTFFQLKFAESAGESLPIYERQSPFDRRGRDTGQTAIEAKGSLMVELIVKGQSQPLWRDTLKASSGRSFREDITDETLRKSMLEDLAYRISELNFPYFIPATPEHLALPVVLQEWSEFDECPRALPGKCRS